MITKNDLKFLSDDSICPFLDDDNWLVVLLGEEDGRRKTNKNIYAITEVTIRLSSKKNLVKCIEALNSSNMRLQKLDVAPNFDRRRVKTKDLKVKFGIAWYEKELFLQKKDSWTNKTHLNIFKKFNAKPEDFKVEHIV